MKQYQIAKIAGISGAYLSEILAKKKTPSWKTVKKLSKITNTDPLLWFEGSKEEIKKALSKNMEAA